MSIFIHFSYLIGIPVLILGAALTLYLGDKLNSNSIATLVILMILAPVFYAALILVVVFLILFYLLSPIKALFKVLHIHIPKLSNWEYKAKKQLKAELILANYTQEHYENMENIFCRDGVYISINKLTIDITYKTETRSVIMCSGAKLTQKVLAIKNGFIPEKDNGSDNE